MFPASHNKKHKIWRQQLVLCAMGKGGSPLRDEQQLFQLGLHLKREHEVDEYGDCLEVHQMLSNLKEEY